eukprot:Hpha_TRINITY_DN13805_c0_g1::TRINITY_DN13805_c0_g1_i1::g.70022::m.70022/K00227/SC5DL, ERG3; Delta7-sterol 5-desaturase
MCKGRLTAAVTPAEAKPAKEVELNEAEPCDSNGYPLAYSSGEYGETDAEPLWSTVRTLSMTLIAGLCARGDLVAFVLLAVRGVCGVCVEEVAQSMLYDWRAMTAWVVFSAVGASHTYYTHCKAINDEYYVRRRNQYRQWKCQPDKFLSPELQLEEMRLGTFNAGLAAALGMLTPLLSLQGSEWVHVYFDVQKFGTLWYVASFPLFFLWIEAFAYCMHRFWHLKFVYRHFHKVHHRFQPPTAFSAVAFHPIEFSIYVLGGQLYVFVLPLHFTVLLAVGGYTAYYLIEDHTGIMRSAPFPWQPSTKYHDDHHRYFHCNFGQHVLLFDKLGGTLRTVGKQYGENVFGGKGQAAEK